MVRAAREAALEARYREQMERRARQPSRRAIVSRWSGARGSPRGALS
jgi:hypothetical protein